MIIATTNIVKYDLTWNVFSGRWKDIIVTTVVTTASQICWYLATYLRTFCCFIHFTESASYCPCSIEPGV